MLIYLDSHQQTIWHNFFKMFFIYLLWLSHEQQRALLSPSSIRSVPHRIALHQLIILKCIYAIPTMINNDGYGNDDDTDDGDSVGFKLNHNCNFSAYIMCSGCGRQELIGTPDNWLCWLWCSIGNQNQFFPVLIKFPTLFSGNGERTSARARMHTHTCVHTCWVLVCLRLSYI